MNRILDSIKITEMAKKLFAEKRAGNRLDGWFIAKEAELRLSKDFEGENEEVKKALILREIVKTIPIYLSDYQLFAGTQDDAFARSYALINPAFKVEEFSGYCDPAAVFGDIEPSGEFTAERINAARDEFAKTEYAVKLGEVYGKNECYTKEVIFFFEQVTGHLIPDMRYAIKNGVKAMIEKIEGKEGNGYKAFRIALESAIILANRYADLAAEQAKTASDERKAQLEIMEKTLRKVPESGAENLCEAIQAFIIMWQIMCLEQTPNPFAFSVGNADRIFEPYRNGLDRDTVAALFKHFLVFFNVADRSWAISQNIIISGRDIDGNDLTNDSSYALMDAYYDMNLPQPILSVKLHKNTPQKLYEEMGRFLFTPGALTPSFFNDDSLFAVLSSKGVADCDLADISIAGCQEPLIMGKDNGNTTNSWLNLPKILEMTLTGGVSTITGEKLVDVEPCRLENVREAFWQNVERFVAAMGEAANGASVALSTQRVPFLSCLMGGLENGIDARDTKAQGTEYNGSGCLIHGVSVIADSFAAIDKLLAERPEDADKLVDALKADFNGYEDLREFLLSADKFGNNIESVDREAGEIASKVADIVSSTKNYLGNSFRPDFSSPSTHLLYGYWVGATPDGRKSRDMLGYGVDPLYGSAENGLGFRMLSNMKMPFEKMNGGYASHLGIDPKYFTSDNTEGKGVEFRDKVINPLFFNPMKDGVSPFYLYVNVTTAEILRKVLADPKKYAPSGVYIMRIHGTFVNFLDLSPAIQQDIITRLDPKSTVLC
ncbi:MAG: pyruvate formate lyase family protein [Acutalibacteraceae bacterium]|nr:pyruvate formate lyase family protein [Acutalibacteraceae bacterium]